MQRLSDFNSIDSIRKMLQSINQNRTNADTNNFTSEFFDESVNKFLEWLKQFQQINTKFHEYGNSIPLRLTIFTHSFKCKCNECKEIERILTRIPLRGGIVHDRFEYPDGSLGSKPHLDIKFFENKIVYIIDRNIIIDNPLLSPNQILLKCIEKSLKILSNECSVEIPNDYCEQKIIGLYPLADGENADYYLHPKPMEFGRL